MAVSIMVRLCLSLALLFTGGRAFSPTGARKSAAPVFNRSAPSLTSRSRTVAALGRAAIRSSTPAASVRLRLSSESSSAVASNAPDWGEMFKYCAATGIQFGLLAGLFKLLDKAAASAAMSTVCEGGKIPSPLVGLLFAFLSLRSRVASVLDNSRPNRESQGGKATPSDVKRPSWTPPGIAFPFIWLTITALRGISSAFVYREMGALFTTPLLAMILHLSIGDTWNTITNVEKRLGVSAVGCMVVWASVWNAIVRYYNILPLAGKILSPSGVWISIATILTFSIWRINKPIQPLWPAKGDGKSAGFKWSNLGQIQATSIGGSNDAVLESAGDSTGSRINTKIDLESKKVATMDELKLSTKKVFCRCWQSGTFPLCDGSHMKHNEATGDNVGPIIVSVEEKK